VPTTLLLTWHGLSSFTVRNTHTAPIAVRVSGSEKASGARRAGRFTTQTKTIPAGKTVTFKVKTPSTLLKALRKAKKPRHRLVRKPAITVLNTATGGKSNPEARRERPLDEL
jgi:hypothetical protein